MSCSTIIYLLVYLVRKTFLHRLLTVIKFIIYGILIVKLPYNVMFPFESCNLFIYTNTYLSVKCDKYSVVLIQDLTRVQCINVSKHLYQSRLLKDRLNMGGKSWIIVQNDFLAYLHKLSIVAAATWHNDVVSNLFVF